MPGDRENGDPGIETPKTKKNDAQPSKIEVNDARTSKFEGSSSIVDNTIYPFGFRGPKPLRLSQMTSLFDFDFSKMPCIFGSPQYKYPDLSKYLARPPSWDLSNTDISFNDEPEVSSGYETSHSLSYRPCDRMNSSWPDSEMRMTSFGENVPDREDENQAEQSDTESLGIDTSDILLLDSPNENSLLRTDNVSYCANNPNQVQHNSEEIGTDEIAPNSEYHQNQNENEGMIIYADEIAPNSEDYQTENEGELPNIRCNTKRRCLNFEPTGSLPRHLDDDLYPDSITTDISNVNTKPADKQSNMTKPVSADKQQNPAKPKFGSFSSCLVTGIGLHLNSLVPIPYSPVRQEPNNGLAAFMEQEEALHLNSLAPIPCSAAHQDSNNALPVLVEQKEAEERNISQSNWKKKRRRMENGEEIEGCKRCKCKKSKCLKLYCECFAGGVYCMNSCSCKECFNKPLHKEMVKETRNLILSRNPLAFEPRVTVPEIGKVDSSITPASARHKKGCNCRKSSCLKKYCECYQGGVGCSIDCRCDGCRNPLGKKDDSQEEDMIMLDIDENETILFNNVENNQDSELFPTPIKDGSQEEETIMLDNAENETILFSNVEHNQDSELFPTPIKDGSQEEETIMLDNAEYEAILFSNVEHNQESEFFPTPIKDGSKEKETIMLDNAEYEAILFSNVEHNQESEFFHTPIKDGSQERETIMLDNAEYEAILFSNVEHNQESEFFPIPIKDGSQEEEETIMFENAENETLLLNNVEHNQDSELCPTPIEAVRRGEEKTQPPSSAIKRPPWLSNLSAIPEFSYNAGKRVGKENMLPPQPMFEKQLETVQQEDEPRVQFSPGNGIKTSSSSPNSKRVSSPYKAGGSFSSSSRSGRKKVLQSIP